MARKKPPRITRTPEEHRLYVEALDRQQRERSAAGKAQHKPRKVRNAPQRKAQPAKMPRLYDIPVLPRDYYQ